MIVIYKSEYRQPNDIKNETPSSQTESSNIQRAYKSATTPTYQQGHICARNLLKLQHPSHT